jgi:hypothetical protein
VFSGDAPERSALEPSMLRVFSYGSDAIARAVFRSAVTVLTVVNGAAAAVLLTAVAVRCCSKR